jgi:hypothetical protein
MRMASGGLECSVAVLRPYTRLLIDVALRSVLVAWIRRESRAEAPHSIECHLLLWAGLKAGTVADTLGARFSGEGE